MPFKSPWNKQTLPSPSQTHERAPAPPLHVPSVSAYTPEHVLPISTNQYSQQQPYHDPNLKDVRPTSASTSSSQTTSPSYGNPLLPTLTTDLVSPEAHQLNEPNSTQSSPVYERAGHVNRKNIKTRLRLGVGSPKEDLQDTLKEPSKGIFGRRKSVAVRRKEPTTPNSPLPPTPSPNLNPESQWVSRGAQDYQVSTQQRPPSTFVPYGPDFTREQLKEYSISPADTSYSNSPIHPHQESPARASYNICQSHFEVISDQTITPRPQSQGRPLHYLNTSNQSSTQYTQAQPSSRPSSSHSQNYHPASEQYIHPPILQPGLPQQYPIQDQGSSSGLSHSTIVPMRPAQGPRQVRRPSHPNEHGISTSPAPQPRDPSTLHPSTSPTPPLHKQPSQSTQSSRDDGDATPAAASPLLRTPKDLADVDVAKLLKDHGDLKTKYNNVKRQYFEKKDQLEAMQNTVARQRLDQSRTSLDDGEYITRMTRLDGLVSQLAFGIRKDWKTIPDWLQQSCNKDALQVAKQEMIAVGRAVISRWLADDFFNKYFHPGLENGLSIQLKTIQRNIWTDAPTSHSPEDDEALVIKIVNWRLSTVEGLKSQIIVPEATTTRMAFTDIATKQLVEELQRFLQPSAFAGLEGGIRMIIELAVGILANLPLESRDVSIEYFHPGYPFLAHIMKVETGIPALPASELSAVDVDKRSIHNSDAGSDHEGDEPRKNSSAGFLGGKKLRDTAQASGAGRVRTGASTPQKQMRDDGGGGVAGAIGGGGAGQQDGAGSVRMAVFLALQIRSKMVLAKAPVFRM